MRRPALTPSVDLNRARIERFWSWCWFLGAVLVLSGCPHQGPLPHPTPTPGPTVPPTPGPTPSPSPGGLTPQPLCSDVPLHAEQPYPQPRPLRCGTSNRACTDGAGYKDGDGGGKCNEPNCVGQDIKIKLIHNCPANTGVLWTGADACFQSCGNGGGSANWGPTNYAAALVATAKAPGYMGSLARDWVKKWLTCQLDGTCGIFTTEQFAGYLEITASDVEVWLLVALDEGDSELVGLASEWLEALWVQLALMDSGQPITKLCAYHVDEQGRDWPQGSPDCGGVKDISPASDRAYTAGSRAHMGLDNWLKMATDDPRREHPYSLDGAGARASTAECPVFELWGLPHDAKGKVNLRAWSIPPEKMGTTKRMRTLLQRYIAGNGTCGTETLLALLAKYKPACDLTILRTDRGITTWLGRPDGRSPVCSAVKGGSWAACTVEGGVSTCVSRARDQNHPTGAWVWPTDTQVCEEANGLDPRCVNKATGTVVSLIYCERGGRGCRRLQ